jgi:hypothetical protein
MRGGGYSQWTEFGQAFTFKLGVTMRARAAGSVGEFTASWDLVGVRP